MKSILSSLLVLLASQSAHAYITAAWTSVSLVGDGQYLHEQLRVINDNYAIAYTSITADPKLGGWSDQTARMNFIDLQDDEKKAIREAASGFPCGQFDGLQSAGGERCLVIPVASELSACAPTENSDFHRSTNAGKTFGKCLDGQFYLYRSTEAEAGYRAFWGLIKRTAELGYITGR
jgi:hypothetical protein